MSPHQTKTVTWCLALYASFCWVGCSRGGPGGIFSDGKISVSADKVVVEEREPTLSLPAVLEPSEKIEIQFPFDVKIDRVAVNLGDTVKQGDLLGTLNDQDFNLKLAQLRAERLEQETLLDKNNYFLRNRDRLLEEGKIDKSMYDSLESETKSIDARLSRIKADVALVENQAHALSITSPIAGMVSVKNISPGATVAAHQTLLAIVKNDPVFIAFNMPAADAGAVAKGANIQITIENFPGKNWTAPIVFVAPELDSASHHFNVKAQLANPNQIFKGGMEAEVRFTSPTKAKIMTVPAKAVLQELGKEYLYVIRQNRAWRVRVYTKKSLESPDLLEIMEGLQPNDLVVTEGQEKLKEGIEVNLWR